MVVLCSNAQLFTYQGEQIWYPSLFGFGVLSDDCAEKTVSGARDISALRIPFARNTDSKLHNVREPQVGMS